MSKELVKERRPSLSEQFPAVAALVERIKKHRFGDLEIDLTPVPCIFRGGSNSTEAHEREWEQFT